jgi:hypothetical protein
MGAGNEWKVPGDKEADEKRLAAVLIDSKLTNSGPHGNKS